jgi:hypothetical protein
LRDLLLKDLPQQVSDRLREEKAEADSVEVSVNKPGDVSFVLRLMGTLSSRKTDVSLESLSLNLTRYSDTPMDLVIGVDAPGPAWSRGSRGQCKHQAGGEFR